MKLNIDVTQEEINNGKVFDCQKCPIALSVLKADGNITYVKANSDIIEIMYLDKTLRTIPTQKVEQFMMDFDSQNKLIPVKPMKAQLIFI